MTTVIHCFMEVFIVLHWFLPESGGIQAIPGIPEESILAQGPAKLIILFQWNVEQNSNSAVMVPGFTWTEWHLEWQERNPWSPNRVLAFADTWFGHHQPIICFFLNHHHHHRWHPPLSPPCHHHVFVTVTDGCLPPHPLPTTKTARMMRQCHITNWMSTRRIDTAQWHKGFKVPHPWLWCGNHTMNNDDVIIHCCCLYFYTKLSPITPSSQPTLLMTQHHSVPQRPPQWHHEATPLRDTTTMARAQHNGDNNSAKWQWCTTMMTTVHNDDNDNATSEPNTDEHNDNGCSIWNPGATLSSAMWHPEVVHHRWSPGMSPPLPPLPFLIWNPGAIPHSV